MKVVALVSGGKDSCYAMIKCIHYGHQIVALANLFPSDDCVDELDSYMYQTVGHQIIDTYPQCMGLPLFRRRIRGTPRYKELKYIGTEGDEVEDLLILLSEVKRQIPDIGGVSSGAIASNYQRSRVENVCSRLGLVSLAFLWKQEQGLLLQEMVEKGIEAILVKVAAIGLDPKRHLGSDLATMQPHLLHLKELYGINVCGEGGEYETLTLDFPLFKNARIIIENFQIVLHSSDCIAPVGILHPSAFYLETKTGNLDPVIGDEKTPLNRSEMDWIIEVEGNDIPSDYKSDNWLEAFPVDLDAQCKWNLIVSKTTNEILSIGCWVQSTPKSMEGMDIHLALVLKSVQCRLKVDQLGWDDVLYIHLYLSDMNQFALANDTYLRYITEENCPHGVPSRSTIEIPLVEGDIGKAFIEVLAAKDKTKKATLHRQILYMAGQLGLDPPTMLLVSGGAGVQMQQALINCEAVVKEFGCKLVSSLISLTVYCPAFLTSCERSEICNTLVKYMHKETTLGGDSSKITRNSESNRPPILFILAAMLPKGALVEVKPVVYVPLCEDDHDSDDKIIDDVKGVADADINEIEGFSYVQMTSSCCESFDVCGHLCAATLTLASDAVYKICTQTLHDVCTIQSSDNIEQNKSLTNIARFCMDVLHKRLQKACLFWEDVMSFRVYFVSNVVPFDKLKMAFTEASEIYGFSKEPALLKNDTTFGSPVTSFIPVLGVGGNAEITDVIACELFASRS
ncbi:diphthine--ammonia ligase isoform X3 [Cryptomeria japonica]|uniref:diphthine--ammonia ligase isoform X3 n=1 Tax=Cryptomeria japonica TaxID=3369 RepID=UPI0027D9D85D|nr:diphthine--ammonia ligase isoform X3 [Cryptomeria japonica]